jgi:hypothetical protein
MRQAQTGLFVALSGPIQDHALNRIHHARPRIYNTHFPRARDKGILAYHKAWKKYGFNRQNHPFEKKDAFAGRPA